jgi:hypothetical protein
VLILISLHLERASAYALGIAGDGIFIAFAALFYQARTR